jgi:uncharacterized membrane-anchored protein YjiN (DUF445 family)
MAQDNSNLAENSESEDVTELKGVSVPEAKRKTRASAEDFKALVSKYVKAHTPVSEQSVKAGREPLRSVGGHASLLPLLQLIPWVLGALFVVSFFWDFTGMSVSAFSSTFPLEGLLRIVAVSGLIGFLTNWVAITMLFNPRHQRPLLGQGLIPAQRERVIYRLATAVSEELINEKIIKQKIEENEIIPKYRELAMSVTRGVLEDESFRSELKALTADYVETVLTSDQVRLRIVDFIVGKIEAYVGEGVGGMALKAYRYLKEDDFKARIDKAIHEIPTQLDLVLDEIDTLLDKIPEKIEARAEDIENLATKVVLGFVENLDVYEMVMSNMLAYDEGKLEDLIKNSSNEQLNYIKYLGGALGTLGGLVIWQPIPAVAVFVVLGSLLWAADETLYRIKLNRDRPA